MLHIADKDECAVRDDRQSLEYPVKDDASFLGNRDEDIVIFLAAVCLAGREVFKAVLVLIHLNIGSAENIADLSVRAPLVVCHSGSHNGTALVFDGLHHLGVELFKKRLFLAHASAVYEHDELISADPVNRAVREYAAYQLAGRTDIVVTCLVAFGVVYMLQSVYIADNYRKVDTVIAGADADLKLLFQLVISGLVPCACPTSYLPKS